jgi:hypothetical protein
MKVPAWKLPETGVHPIGNELDVWAEVLESFLAAALSFVDLDARIRPDVNK